ncbi:hypothetical protein [Brevibacillus borstelensis]|uniref:hypothetical protein n=1 Tax=Brevibacillus borstelensis TaxID=45462 RepID=UPI0030C09C60
MKKILKFLSLGISCTLSLLILSSSVVAASGKENRAYQEINRENAFIDPSTGLLITPLKEVGGYLVPISKEEYIANTTNSHTQNNQRTIPTDNKANTINPAADYREYYTYTETTNSTEWSKDWIQVTDGIKCTSIGGCSIGKTVSAQVSHSFSASVGAEKDAISAGASFTWQKTYSSTENYTFNLALGERGYIAFVPRFKKTEGVLYKYSNWDGLLSKKNAWGLSPNGGYYTFVHTDY